MHGPTAGNVIKTNLVELSVRGRNVSIPFLPFEDKKIVTVGSIIRTASIHDEAWSYSNPVKDPANLIEFLKNSSTGADLFTFSQRLPDASPKFPYHYELENLAVAQTSDYDKWLGNLSRKTRQEISRAERMNIKCRVVSFGDELVEAIVRIFNECPVRQGRPFPHFGKDHETVKREVGTLLDHSEFIGAFLNEELVGYIKLVYMETQASILNIVTMDKHYDARPGNALIAKAVQICSEKNLPYLTYGKYIYGKKGADSMTEYKRRNGFEPVDIPRYYVALTMRGKAALGLRLHRGYREMLPTFLIRHLLNARAKLYKNFLVRRTVLHSGS